MARYHTLALIISLIGAALSAPVSANSSWVIALTSDQAAALETVKSKSKHGALAVSPDGAWGNTWGKASPEEAQSQALGNCRGYLRRGRRDCVIAYANGKSRVGQTVQTQTVSRIYKPVSDKKAIKFFGKVNVNFQGNPSAAKAEFDRLIADPNYRKNLRNDPVLRSALQNNSLVSDTHSGFAMWLGQSYGGQRSGSKGRFVRVYIPDWVATRDGLVCFFNEVYSTGKRLPQRCILIDKIQAGALRFNWLHQSPTWRKAAIVPGDARWGAAR